MQEHLIQGEQSPDGSLCTLLDGGARRLHQDPGRNLRLAQLRGSDPPGAAAHIESDAHPPANSAVRASGCSAGESGSRAGARPPATAQSGTEAGPWARNAAGELSARAIAEAVRSAASSRSPDAALQSVIQLALHSGPWDAATISVRGPRGTMQPAAFSDLWAAEADRLQYQLGEGPCLEAVHPDPDAAHDVFVAGADLATEHRWMRWGPAAMAMGVRTVMTLRLFTDHLLGSISLYSRHPRGIDPGASENAEIVAAVGSVVLAQVCAERELWRAVRSRHLIGQAQGMLMQRYGLSADAAFGVLRRYSQQHNTKLAVLAEQLATTGELPDLNLGRNPSHESNI